eukprot:SAG22_NODE_1396_length_4509_cov_15.427211_1_plen_48_part_00
MMSPESYGSTPGLVRIYPHVFAGLTQLLSHFFLIFKWLSQNPPDYYY